MEERYDVDLWEWSRYPFLFGLTGYLCGGLFSQAYKIDLLSSGIITLLILTSYTFLYHSLGTYFKKHYVLSYHIFALFLCLGWFQFSNPRSEKIQAKVESFMPTDDQALIIQGIIKSIDIDSGRSKIEIDVNRIRKADTSISISTKTIVYTKQATDNIKVLDEVVCSIRVFPTMKANPYAFDYPDLLRKKEIYFTGFISNNSPIKVVGNQSSLRYFPDKLRQKVSLILQKYIKNNQTLAMYEAMSIGDRSKLDQSVVDVFSHTGAIHVLAVSGLHVGIIMQLTLMCLSFVKTRNKRWKYLKIAIAIILSFSYAILVGATPSILRASMMFAMLLIGQQLQKYSNIFNILSLIALLILVHNPSTLGTLSFQFSFTAIISIAIYYEYIKRLWSPPNMIISKLWEVIAVSIAVQILMTPFIIYYFHTFPTYFFLNGIFALPLVYITVLGTITLLIANAINVSLAYFLAIPFTKMTEFFYHLLTLLDQLPLNIIEYLYISSTELIMIFTIIALLTSYIFSKKFNYLLSCNVMMILLILLSINRASNQITKQELFIYDTKKGVLVDIFDGHNVLTYQSGPIDQKDIKFASENNRLIHGISNFKIISPINSQRSSQVVVKDNMIYIGNQKLYIPDSTLVLSKALSSDVILINKALKVDYNDVNKITQKAIILPRYLSPKQSNFFRKYFSSNLIHDIKSDGYYHLDLSKSH
jgi:competence protein ComEC